MSKSNVIRAWKDPAYRNSLSQTERASLPANPAGSIEIADTDLGRVTGAARPPVDSIVCTRNNACITHLFYCFTVVRPIC